MPHLEPEYEDEIVFREFHPVNTLLRVGRVATLRSKSYRRAKTVLVKLGSTPVAICDKILTHDLWRDVANPDKPDFEQRVAQFLERYVSISGFRSVQEWLRVAKSLHRGKIPRYLLVLRVRKKLREIGQATLEQFGLCGT